MKFEPKPAAHPEDRLGEILVRAGHVTDTGLTRARKAAVAQHSTLADALSRLGLVSEQDLAVALAETVGAPLISESDMPAAALTIAGLSTKFLRERRILPMRGSDGGFSLVMANPLDTYSLKAFQLATSAKAKIAVAEPSGLERVFDRLYGAAEAAHAASSPAMAETDDLDIARLRDLASEAPVIQLVNALIARAVEDRASDIHLEPFEAVMNVRFRIDGTLRPGPDVPANQRAAIVSRIKIMANLDIAERRLPQDGRFKAVVRGRSVDLRISTLPIMHGESVVIRVLDRDSVVLDFDALGIEGQARDRLEACLALPSGIVLATGPTGSGKTTTLYAALTTLKSGEKKMLTVEDPVEFQVAGVNQVQVRPAIDLDFARVLRSMLRQDPDVIMVGEIRDGETARIAAQSALTGHLVLSTLHTNDAAGAVTRLLDMGLEGFLLASTLSGVAAQRLVRRLCPTCREAYEPSERMTAELGLAEVAGTGPLQFWRAVGCTACGEGGYRGRTMVLEVLTITDRLRELIMARASAAEITNAAIAEGMRPLFLDGVAKALSGVTSLQEVLAVARPAGNA